MKLPSVSLLEHIMALLAERDLRYKERFEGQEDAIKTALTATERRFEGVNEFRATLSDQAQTFATRDQVEALREVVSALAARVDKTEGKSTGMNAGWLLLVGAVSVVGTLIVILTR